MKIAEQVYQNVISDMMMMKMLHETREMKRKIAEYEAQHGALDTLSKEEQFKILDMLKAQK
jgi:phosphopantothenate synthetase